MAQSGCSGDAIMYGNVSLKLIKRVPVRNAAAIRFSGLGGVNPPQQQCAQAWGGLTPPPQQQLAERGVNPLQQQLVFSC